MILDSAFLWKLGQVLRIVSEAFLACRVNLVPLQVHVELRLELLGSMFQLGD